ncbi:MAG TPA: DUF6067 family protein [bacterium]|nr:DUF6067 family protein [bacterium]
MKLHHRMIAAFVSVLCLAFSAFSDDAYRWPKAQLLPPPPAAEPPFLVIPQTSDVPEIDGDLSDACWKNAVCATPFMLSYEGLYAEFPTTAKILYDEKNIYFAFDCMKTNPERHTANEFAEVLLTPPNTKEFYKAAASETGTLDTLIWGGIPVPKWQEPLRHAVKPKGTGWAAEIAVPFAAMGVTMPEAGTVWKANLGRRATLGFRYNVAWAITYAWFYEPDFFGSIRFGGPSALSAEFSEISAPAPNRNDFRIQFVNRDKQAGKCEIAVSLSDKNISRTVFLDEVLVHGGKSVEVPAFYDLSDGGQQVATISVREKGTGNLLLHYSIPSFLPLIRQPFQEGCSILKRYGEPGKENFLQTDDDRAEFQRISQEAQRLQPLVENPNAAQQDWESLQESVERFAASAEKLEWWTSNRDLLADRDFAVGTETSLNKLIRDKAFSGSATHLATIQAARGEFEAVQLVIVPRQRELKNVRVQVDSLKGRQGSSISAENIQWRWVDFVKTRQPHCPIDYIGWYSDPLLPGTPRTIPQETIHQPIWITVQVPAGIPAGNYRGTLQILADDQPPWDMDFSVQVYNFDLPKRPALKTSLWLHPTKLAEWYGWKETPDDIRRNQYAFLLEHRINPAPIEEPYIRVEDLPFCIERGMNAVQLGFAAAADWPIKQPEYVQESYDFLKEKGLLDLGFIYAQDEPSPGQYSEVRDELLRVGEAFPGLRRTGTISPPAQPLEGVLDCWVVGPNLYHYKPVEERVKAGDEMWLYLSASVKRPFVNWYIDYTAVENRLITWYCWKYGATGVLYWGINEWMQNTKPWTGDPEIDDAIKKGVRWPDVPWNTWSYLNSNGEAQLIYPGPYGEFWSSIRLEVIRDAIEDYDYFSILADSCKKLDPETDAVLLAESKALLNLGAPIAWDLTKHTDDPADLLDRRNEVARQIARNLRAMER